MVGLGFTLAQVALLAAVGLSLDLAPGPGRVPLGLFALVTQGLIGYAWGMLGSSRTGAVLPAVGLITGSYSKSTSTLEKVEGVSTVEQQTPIRIPPPESDVQ